MSPETIVCPYCGSSLSADTSLCPACGGSVEQTERPLHPDFFEPPTVVSRPLTPPPPPPDTTADSIAEILPPLMDMGRAAVAQQQRKWTPWIVGGCVLLFVGCCLVLVLAGWILSVVPIPFS